MKTRTGARLMGAAINVAMLLTSTRDAAACVPVLLHQADTYNYYSSSTPLATEHFSRAVYLIKPAELQGTLRPSQLAAIGWSYRSGTGTAGSGMLKIYLQNTSDTVNNKSATWTTAVSGMTLVHNAATTLPGNSGPFEITFTGGPHFNYGGGGLYVAFDWQADAPQSGYPSVWCEISLDGGMKSNRGDSQPPTTLLTSSFRPDTTLRPLIPFSDASVESIRTLGATVAGSPLTVEAIVRNRGTADRTNVSVTLTDETGSLVQTIPTLPACSQTLVSYTLHPTTEGSNAVTVRVPTDPTPAHDSLSHSFEVTANKYSYKEGGPISTQGSGFTGGSGFMVGRFSTEATTQVDAVVAEFLSVTASSYRVAVFGDNGSGTPGDLLYLDAADRTTSAPGSVIMRTETPVLVGPGSFYVGLWQTSAVSMDLASELEEPIRASSFYFSISQGGFWADFSLVNLTQKLSLGAIVGNCQTPLSVDVTPDAPGPLSSCAGEGFELTATPIGGTAPFIYQWTKDGVDIPGATSPTYIAANNASGDHYYNCKVTDSGGCVDREDSASIWATWYPGPSSIPPGEIPGFGFCGTNKDCLQWTYDECVPVHRVYAGSRATLPGLLDGAPDSCLVGDFPFASTGSISLPPPPAGSLQWFLVTGVNDAGEGGAGSGSATPRHLDQSEGCQSPLVINEVDYDMIGNDSREFVEIANPGPFDQSLAGLALVFNNGSFNGGAEYLRVDLSAAGSSLEPGQYLVVADSATVVAPSAFVLRFVAPDNNVQNGSPDGLCLFDTTTNTVLDALSYEGTITAATILGAPGTYNLVEGNPTSASDSNSAQGCLSRMPNGRDTNNAQQDWIFSSTPTPGTANVP